MLYRLSTVRQQDNPVRVQTWNGSFRAGDDFKMAVTVYGDDNGTLAITDGSRSRLALFADDRPRGGYAHDYGWGWSTLSAQPARTIEGYAVEGQPGRINFAIPASETGDLCGRYRLALQVDLFDGLYTEVEGVLQVRLGAPDTLGHKLRTFFQLDHSHLDGPDVLAANVTTTGYPIDADGFFVNTGTVVGIPQISGGLISGIGVIDGTTGGNTGGGDTGGGNTGGGTGSDQSSGVLGIGYLGVMVLG